jgi:hypothetical protein
MDIVVLVVLILALVGILAAGGMVVMAALGDRSRN